MVSSDFGKDDASRHVTLGLDWAMAGAASVAAAAAAPTPVTPALRMNERRSMQFLPFWINDRTPGILCSRIGLAKQYTGKKSSPAQRTDLMGNAMQPCNYS